MQAIMVYVTYPDKTCASAISRQLVEERLVACANIFPAHESVYWWEGAVQEATEIAVIYKTQAGMFEKLEQKVKALHPYECPCIVSISLENGHKPFMDWIAAQTGG